MKAINQTFAALLIGAAMTFAATGASAAQPMKDFHKGVACESCHGEKEPTAPTQTNCTGCHGTPEDVAKLTAGKYKQYYNPHDSLHYATYADCVLCHREHSESRLDCNNARCHAEFKYAVP